MSTQERAAIYEHCAKLAEQMIEDMCKSGDYDALTWMERLAHLIREHKADQVKYP